MKAIYVGSIVSPVMEIVGAVGLAMVVYFGGQEVLAGNITAGEFMAFITAVGLVFDPIRKLGGTYSKLQDAVAASERVFEIIDIQNKIVDGPKILKEDIKTIKYKDVVLRYEQSNILDGITLSIKKGEHIALVGDSGGGKSTFVQMLLRYYDPNKGEVVINGENIKNFTLSSLKSHISFVTQKVYIFNDSVAANVAYGCEDIDKKRVYEALEQAHAMEFVKKLGGIDVVLDEGGSNLSGGQRQRIAIARAIYKYSSVLLLDEATSALDNESEAKIKETLEEIAKDKITITIAHRLSTIEHVDRILFLRKGKIIAEGSYEELLKNSAEFRQLAKQLK
jgi:subfamily B ATP-binding cassette protein MsbA